MTKLTSKFSRNSPFLAETEWPEAFRLFLQTLHCDNIPSVREELGYFLINIQVDKRQSVTIQCILKSVPQQHSAMTFISAETPWRPDRPSDAMQQQLHMT